MVDQILKQAMVLDLQAGLAGTHNLLPHQAARLNRIVEWHNLPTGQIRNGDNAPKLFEGGSLQGATGTGKTWEELFLAYRMTMSGRRAVIISPRLLINDHIHNTYTNPARLNLDPDDIAVFDSARNEPERIRALGARIMVTTDKSFLSLNSGGSNNRRLSPDPKHPNYRPLIILDESDILVGSSMLPLLREYAKNSIVWSFSATDYGVSRRLYGNQPRVDDLDIRPAVQGGLLTRGINTGVTTVDLDPAQIQQYMSQIQNSGNLDDETQREFAMNAAVVAAAMRFHAFYVDDDAGPVRRLPTLIKAPDIESAEFIANTFNNYFGPDYAVAVSHRTPRADVLDQNQQVTEQGMGTILEALNRGQQRVVVYPEILGRGVDIVNASVLISTVPYFTPRRAKQDLGRTTRDEETRVGNPANYQDLFHQSKVSVAWNIIPTELAGQTVLFSNIIGSTSLHFDPQSRVTPSGTHTPPAPLNLPDPGGMTMITDTEELETLRRQSQSALEAREAQIPQGWNTIQDAADLTGLSMAGVRQRIDGIVQNRRYMADGMPPQNTAREVTFPGRELVMNVGRLRLISDRMIDGITTEIGRSIEERRAQGGKTPADYAAELGVTEAVVLEHLARIRAGTAQTEKVGETDKAPSGVVDQLDQKKDGKSGKE